jgi:Cys-tRNA(Pro) deacylase
MHGDREVSTKELARQIGAREVVPASVAAVEKHTGYVPGGVSPFGTRKPLPVYVEGTILALERFLVNGGRRGFLVEIRPADLLRVLSPVEVSVAIAP